MQAKLPKPQRKLEMAVLEAAEDLVEEETDPGVQHLWAPGCSSLSFTTMPGRAVLFFRATTSYVKTVERLHCKRPIPIRRLFFKIDLLTYIAALCLTDL
jgi:hypothetical protein